jgi:hypothetical protein
VGKSEAPTNPQPSAHRHCVQLFWGKNPFTPQAAQTPKRNIYSPFHKISSMKNTLLSTLLLLFATSLLAQTQAPMFEWARPMPSGSTPDEPGAEPYDFRADAAGNTYVYGIFYEKIDFGNGISLSPLSADNEALFLAKLGPDGKALWAKRIAMPLTDPSIDTYNEAPGLAVDADGSVFVSGSLFSSALDFGDGVSLTKTCQFGCSDAFVAKFSASGQALWAKKITSGDGNNNTGNKLALHDGHLYLAGNFDGSKLDFGNGAQYNTPALRGGFLAKMQASDGKPLWAKFIHNAQDQSTSTQQVEVTKSGEIWLSGYYDSDISFGNGIQLAAFGGFSRNNYFFARYTADGTPVSAHNLNASYIDLLDIDWEPTSGGLYVVCNYSDTLRTGDGLLGNSSEDYVGTLLYLSANGFGEVLSVPYSHDGYSVTGVAADKNGDFYMAGFFNSGDMTVAGVDIENVGCFDSYLLKGNLNGALTWARGVGGAGCEAIIGGYYGKCLDLNAEGDLYVSGAYVVGMRFDNFTRLGSGLVAAKMNTGTVSALEPSLGPNFALAPNPTSGTFQLTLETMPETASWLLLHDLQGREVYRQVVNAPVTEVSAGLQTGVYTLSLLSERGVSQLKLVVQQQ